MLVFCRVSSNSSCCNFFYECASDNFAKLDEAVEKTSSVPIFEKATTHIIIFGVTNTGKSYFIRQYLELNNTDINTHINTDISTDINKDINTNNYITTNIETNTDTNTNIYNNNGFNTKIDSTNDNNTSIDNSTDNNTDINNNLDTNIVTNTICNEKCIVVICKWLYYGYNICDITDFTKEKIEHFRNCAIVLDDEDNELKELKYRNKLYRSQTLWYTIVNNVS